MYFYDGIAEYLPRLNDHILSVEELKDITYKLIKYIEIEDYFSGIFFNMRNTLDLGSYNFHTKEIKIHRKHLIWTAEDDFKRANLIRNRITFINLSILEALFHEIVHAIQNFVASEADWPLSPLFKLDIVYFNNNTISDEDYDRYHDSFLYEREANTTALENILRIIKEYIHDEDLYEYFKNRLHGFMVENYTRNGETITSPLEFVYKELYGLDVPCVHNMDLYDRIKLGFTISSVEYDEYIHNKDDMILAKNNLK